MHQSFVFTAPSGPGISGAFNFSIFKAPLKALLSGAKIVDKSLLNAPALPGADNTCNEEQQMTRIEWINFPCRSYCDST